MVNFPVELLDGAETVICFFSTQFQGQNDVRHVHQQGIKKVVLVDIDDGGMEEMKKIYPEEWEYIVGDAFEVVQKMNETGRKFDVVIADPFLSMVDPVLCDHFDDFYGLCNKWFIVTAQLGMELSQYAQLHGKDMRLTMRNTQTGCCWLSIKKERDHA